MNIVILYKIYFSGLNKQGNDDNNIPSLDL